jgi:hypothetical protein
MRVVALRRPARGFPPVLEHEASHMKTGQSEHQGKGDVIVHVWTDKRHAQMKSMIHDAAVVNAERKDRTNLQIK